MDEQVKYVITFTGNAADTAAKITGKVDGLNKATGTASKLFAGLSGKIIVFNQLSQSLQELNQSLMAGAKPGLDFNKSMAELEAITGLGADKLNEIEASARKASTTFGGSAAKSVESYKLILSQLGPEIANVPSALASMGDSVAKLSKTMDNDAVAATEVLTTAMNQYQVSLADPTEASRKMAEMMNIMSAAAKVGSAELPAIKAALENSGMAAKMAGVEFAELNAGIQVLDKAGKKGAEGGVAIRNALSILSQGRFMPKKTADALKAAGIDIVGLGDKSKTFAERLRMLQPIMNDTALIGEIFGRENANAGTALIAGIDQMEAYTKQIQGTNSATEQANIIMASKAEMLERVRAKADSFRISIFNVTGSMLPYMEVMMQTLVPVSQMIPLMSALAQGIAFVTSAQKMKAVWDGITTASTTVLTGATWLLNAALAMNPIVWIVAGIVALVAVLVLAWQKIGWFRGAILAAWETIKQFGSILKDFVIDRIKGLLSGIAGIGSALVKLFKGDFAGAWDSAKNAVGDLVGVDAVKKAVGSAKAAGVKIGAAYQDGVKQVADKKVTASGSQAAKITTPGVPGSEINPAGSAAPAGGVIPEATGNITSGGTRNTEIHISFKNMVEKLVFEGGLKESAEDAERKLTEIMVRVLNSAYSTN